MPNVLVITYLLEVYIHGEHSSKLWDQMTTTSIFLQTTNHDYHDDGGAQCSFFFFFLFLFLPSCVYRKTQRDRRNTEREMCSETTTLLAEKGVIRFVSFAYYLHTYFPSCWSFSSSNKQQFGLLKWFSVLCCSVLLKEVVARVELSVGCFFVWPLPHSSVGGGISFCEKLKL